MCRTVPFGVPPVCLTDPRAPSAHIGTHRHTTCSTVQNKSRTEFTGANNSVQNVFSTTGVQDEQSGSQPVLCSTDLNNVASRGAACTRRHTLFRTCSEQAPSVQLSNVVSCAPNCSKEYHCVPDRSSSALEHVGTHRHTTCSTVQNK